jgi:quinol monooxygenase YgiN
MITIIVKSIVKEGMKDKFLEKAMELVDSSRAERGCLSYNLYEDTKDSKIMTFIEEWIDEKAIQKHNNSEHFTRIVPELAKLREGKPELNLYKAVFPK